MIAAASLYLANLRGTPNCRFDAVLLDSLDEDRIEWLRDIITL
jgi:Holliday junction resolvase-like predicted endonuclease